MKTANVYQPTPCTHQTRRYNVNTTWQQQSQKHTNPQQQQYKTTPTFFPLIAMSSPHVIASFLLYLCDIFIFVHKKTFFCVCITFL